VNGKKVPFSWEAAWVASLVLDRTRPAVHLPRHSARLPRHSFRLPCHSQRVPYHSQQAPRHSQQVSRHSQRVPRHSFRLPCHSSRMPCHSSRLPCHSLGMPCHSFRLPRHSSRMPRHSSRLPCHSGRVPRHSFRLPCHSSRVPRHSFRLPCHSWRAHKRSTSALPLEHSGPVSVVPQPPDFVVRQVAHVEDVLPLSFGARVGVDEVSEAITGAGQGAGEPESSVSLGRRSLELRNGRRHLSPACRFLRNDSPRGHPSSAVARNLGTFLTFVACSKANASLISVGSLQAGPMNERPMGRPRA
jgi:hypothetical protein